MNIPRPESQQPIPDHAKKVFEGVMFDVYQWEQEMYDGSTTTFEKLRRADTVIVFAVMDDGRILLTRQEQPGKKPFIGAAGGRVDPGEEVFDAAKRELLEETGYEASDYVLWDAQNPSSKVEWCIYTFIAKGITKVADLNLDPGEKIELMPVTLDELLAFGKDEEFIEYEIKPQLLEASLDPEKKEELQKLFSLEK